MAQEAEKISVIAALSRNRAIGKDNQLLWQIPGDLPRFKKLTTGHPVIMGRKTWESIPEKFRPLPGRTNIVITRDSSYDAPGAVLAQSFPEALSRARDAEGSEEIFAIGGQQVYECALPFATNLYLTLVDEEKDGDAFFPAYEDQFSKETLREEHEYEGFKYVWLDLERS
ncbi:MAG: dihydrofolate reductase [Patescibacteria group bacterium]